jgi:HEAT repeats
VRVRFQKTVLSTILLCFGFNPSLRGMQDRERENAAAHVKPADRPALIQCKTIEAWLAALKDSDPAARKRAIKVLGERTLDPTLPADQKASLETEVRSLLFSDKDAAVRQAAAFSPICSRLLVLPRSSIAFSRSDSHNVGPGEVMLWDTTTGERVANLRATDRGVVSVAFSPDDKLLAGRDYVRDDHRALNEVVLWNVSSR